MKSNLVNPNKILVIWNREFRRRGLARTLVPYRVERAFKNLNAEGFSEKFKPHKPLKMIPNMKP